MVDALEIAKRFHDVYEKLAPSFGYITRGDTKVFDPNSPNGKLMIAVCQEVCDQIEASARKIGFDQAILEAPCYPAGKK